MWVLLIFSSFWHYNCNQIRPIGDLHMRYFGPFLCTSCCIINILGYLGMPQMALDRNHATEYKWDWGQDSDPTIQIYGIFSVWTNSDGDLFLCLGTDKLYDPLSLKFQITNILAMCYKIGRNIIKCLQTHTFLSRATLSFKESFDMMSLHWFLKGQLRHDWCYIFSICD